MKESLGFRLLDVMGKFGGTGGIAAEQDCRVLRNWVAPLGYDPGHCAGTECLPGTDRQKFIDQIGHYLGWNPPPHMNWTVQFDMETGRMAFFRDMTEEEKERLLSYGYKQYEKTTETAQK